MKNSNFFTKISKHVIPKFINLTIYFITIFNFTLKYTTKLIIIIISSCFFLFEDKFQVSFSSLKLS